MSYSEVTPNLWMGGEQLPLMPNFPAVVDCRMLEDLSPPSFAHHAFLWIPFIDGPKLPPIGQIHIARKFIAAALAESMVVCCHCAAGHNRSGLIVAYYLISNEAMAPQAAIDLIREKRGPEALSNQTFVNFLLGYGKCEN